MTSGADHRVADAVIRIIAGRWVLAVLHEIDSDVKRYGELLSAIDGISEKVLTETLRRMQRDGLVVRQVSTGAPNYVAYRATSLARTLDQPLRGLLSWRDAHWDAVEASRQLWDQT
jgi:DNA-binding HxlR family transcriptional regulator